MSLRLYLESSFISYLAARVSVDPIKRVRQQFSSDLWALRGGSFEAFYSPLVLEEIQRGDPLAAQNRVQLCKDLPLLPLTDRAQDLAKALIATHAVPATEPEDALHIALAASAQMDYIVTWNFAHLVSPAAKVKLQRVLSALSYDNTLLATPEELMESVFSANTSTKA